MIWGCITAEGAGPLYFVEGTMRSDQYIKVLKTILLPYLGTLEGQKEEYTFMQDGAPCHTSILSQKCLREIGLEVLPWAGNSPDLNPIENCWAYLKTQVYKLNNPTINILKENIKKIWEHDDGMRQMIAACIKSMPDRVKAVLQAKGKQTKY